MSDTIRVFVPVAKEPAFEKEIQASTQRANQSALVIGLLDNHKHNTDKILDRLQERLSQAFDGLRFVRAKKPEAGRRAPETLIADLAARCQAVVNGIGD
ncbi:MAG: hypothetical protein HY322_16395 [Betaproteobacteria bacterium]|nr:hypothetical protein [Betaproteobacteria bacterium]